MPRVLEKYVCLFADTFTYASKGSKVDLRSVYLAAFEYFRRGIMRFDRPIRIEHFTSCARVVARQPWVRGCLRTSQSTPLWLLKCNFIAVDPMKKNWGTI